MADVRTHYDVLGIDAASDAVEIRRAWRLLVQVWHPDRFSGETRDQAELQASRINEAWSVLRDAERRATYDARLACEAGAASTARDSRSAPFGGGPFGGGPFGGQPHLRRPHPVPAHDEPPANAVAPPPRPLGELAVEIWCTARRYPRMSMQP